jgi:hypothetical protein
MQMMPQQQEQLPPMQPGDEQLYVQFYMGSMKNEEKSTEAGHPVFDAVPFVKILVPGDRNTVINTSVNNQHKRRFARLWSQFEQNQMQTVEGMPIQEWPAITRAQADELFYLNIVTVEQLANLADVYGSRIMGFNDLKRKAQTYLEAAKDAALAEKLSAENANLQGQVNYLQEELRKVNQRFEALENAKHQLVSP